MPAVLTAEEVAAIVEKEIERLRDPYLREAIRSILVRPTPHEVDGGEVGPYTSWLVAQHKEAGAELFYLHFFPGKGIVSLWNYCSWFGPDNRGYTYGSGHLIDAFYGLIRWLDRAWNVVQVHEDGLQTMVDSALDFNEALLMVTRDNWKLDRPIYKVVPNKRMGKQFGAWNIFKWKDDGTRQVIASSLTYDEAFDRLRQMNSHFGFPLYEMEKETE